MMLTFANKGRYVVKKCQKHVYIICEGSLKRLIFFLKFLCIRGHENCRKIKCVIFLMFCVPRVMKIVKN